MAPENPVLLMARPPLAGLLAEHLALPAPYVFRHGLEGPPPALLILDAEMGADWKAALASFPETPLIQLGGMAQARAARHFPFPLHLALLEQAILPLLPHIAMDSPPVAIGKQALFSLEQRSLWHHAAPERKIALTQKEGELLQRLLEAKGREITREALLGEIWGYDGTAASHTVETHLYRLRQKLKEAGAEDIRIDAAAGALRLVIT